MPTPPPRQRGALAVWLVVLVALGFVSRRPGVPESCVLYVGDVLWGALFFGLAAFARPSAAPLRLWVVATVTTELIELSQLYQAPWAQAVRATRLGGLLLGHSFSWSDTVCVAVGATAAALVDARLRKTGTAPQRRAGPCTHLRVSFHSMATMRRSSSSLGCAAPRSK